MMVGTAEVAANAIAHCRAVARCNQSNMPPAVSARIKDVDRLSIAAIRIFSNAWNTWLELTVSCSKKQAAIAISTTMAALAGSITWGAISRSSAISKQLMLTV